MEIERPFVSYVAKLCAPLKPIILMDDSVDELNHFDTQSHINEWLSKVRTSTTSPLDFPIKLH